jgi:hypothetical protein
MFDSRLEFTSGCRKSRRVQFFAMAQNQPRWLKLVHRLERTIGTHVEAAVRSDTYFDVIAQATKARNRLTGTVEGLQREWLHLLNMPAGTDIKRLREQLARMERGLAELTKELADRDETDGNSRRPPRAK